MAIRCKGCGALMQNFDPAALGYSPKKEAEYCQRCFRMTHYNDPGISLRRGIDEDKIMEKAARIPGLIVWTADVFDLEAAMLSAMSRHFIGRRILLVLTKCDLLPKTLSDDKLYRFLLSRLKEWQFKPVGIVLVHQGKQADIEELKAMIDAMKEADSVLFMGRANAGKSTLINALCSDHQLTVTRYPGTTVDFNEIDMDGWKLIDTPGLLNRNSLLIQVRQEDLKTVLPDRPIKPQVYQLWQDQSFALGGLCRIDILTSQAVSAVFYLSGRLPLHRSQLEKADALWKNHQGTLFSPTVEEPYEKWQSFCFRRLKGKNDFCIAGLGWMSLEGEAEQVRVAVPKQVEVYCRKAMI